MPHVVHEPAGRRHDHVHAGLEGPLLWVHGDAAEDGHARHGGVVRQPLDLIFDLHGEFSRGSQDERSSGCRAVRRGMEESLQNRDEERGGLAGTGLGARDHVAAGQRKRDDATLHRSRFA